MTAYPYRAETLNVLSRVDHDLKTCSGSKYMTAYPYRAETLDVVSWVDHDLKTCSGGQQPTAQLFHHLTAAVYLQNKIIIS